MEVHTLADAVRRAAAARPQAPALIAGDDVTTWSALDARVDRVAAGLTALALPGDGAPARVVIALPHAREFAEVLFGVWRAGLIAVPVNPASTPREVAHVLADSQAAVLVTTGAIATGLATTRSADPLSLAHTYVIGPRPGGTRPFAQLVASDATPPPASTAGGEDVALLLYVSAAQGRPRAAMVTHRALIANHRQLERVDPPVVGPDDTVLLSLPFFHALGLNAGLGAVAWHGACGVLLDRFDADSALAAIAERHVTVVATTPAIYAAWAEHRYLADPLATVRVFISAGAPLDPAVARRFPRQILEGYGLAEAGPVVALADAAHPKIGSVGRPLPGVEVKLVDGDGVDVFGADPGAVVVRGENLFSGYWPSGVDGPDDDGWWPTGDVAYADGDGDLFLVDRLDDRILVSGLPVYPREVELVLATHPGVAEVCVVPVTSPATGQAAKAYVVATAPEITSEQLAAHAARNLARFKCPVSYEFVEVLPRRGAATSTAPVEVLS